MKRETRPRIVIILALEVAKGFHLHPIFPTHFWATVAQGLGVALCSFPGAWGQPGPFFKFEAGGATHSLANFQSPTWARWDTRSFPAPNKPSPLDSFRTAIRLPQRRSPPNTLGSEPQDRRTTSRIPPVCFASPLLLEQPSLFD